MQTIEQPCIGSWAHDRTPEITLRYRSIPLLALLALVLTASLAVARPAHAVRCVIHNGTSCPGAVLNNRNLHGAHLKGAHLQRAHLVHANLRGADLRGANLTGADLRYSNLTGAKLTGAHLQGARLAGAILTGVSGKIIGRPASLPAGWVLKGGYLARRKGPVAGHPIVLPPPVLSGIAADASTFATTFATTISWVTDQPSASQVEYGMTAAYGSSTTLDTSLVTGHSQALVGLTPGTTYHYRVSSRNAGGQLATSGDFTFTTPAAKVPLIVDTDIFSGVDDVGGLATAFALQRNGEANVVAAILDTRTSRPAVATNSWQCTAAIAQFYGSTGTLLGSDTPNNGTATNAPHDFIGPCASKGTPVPTPPSAVSVYRQALASEPDGSVVIASIGYFENLSALLNSAPDAFSPLNGHDLIAKKVRMLVAMAGRFPDSNGNTPENNLAGNPGAAQDVAAHWPTEIVWSGYEVGINVKTGSMISSAQPSSSPVRAAYESFLGGPNNWYYSFDLTAVYYVIRPWDPALTVVGPGTDAVTSTGGNTFTMGAGNQYYLHLNDVTGLQTSLNSLLDAPA